MRDARADAVRTEARLDRLEARQAELTRAIAARRDEVAAVKQELIGTRVGLQPHPRRQGRRPARRAPRAPRARGRTVGRCKAQQAKIQATLQRSQAQPGLPAGPIRQGGGSMIWPVNGPITVAVLRAPLVGELPPGHRHRRARRARRSAPRRRARVALLQSSGASGGYGNFTCVQHSGSLSTCYAHQSRFATSMGASVAKGQVIGYVGSTGQCFGDHLHFEVRVNGAVVNPLAYL